MKKIRLFSLVLLLLYVSTSYALENFLDAKVVSLSGDTLFGQVDYQNWNLNPEKIAFKESENAVVQYFVPSDIKGFAVGGEFYLSATVQIEVSPILTSRLTEDPSLDFETQTVFLQTLFDGEKSLYFLRTNNAREYFYIKVNGELDLLVYKRFIKSTKSDRGHSKEVVSEYKKYVGQLTFYFDDNASLKSKINAAEYTYSDLTSVFEKYYDMDTKKVAFRYKQQKQGVYWGLLAGVSKTSLSFSTSEDEVNGFLERTDFSTSVSPVGGVFLDITLPRNNKKWSLNNELIYMSYAAEGEEHYYYNINNHEINETEIGFSYIKINNMIRFNNYFNESTVLYFNIGVSNGFRISETNKRVWTRYYYTTTPTITEQEANEDLRKHEQGLIFGAGMKFNRLLFDVRWETTNGLVQSSSIKCKTNNFYFLIGYQL